MESEMNTVFIAAASALSGVILSQVITVSLSVFDKRHQRQILLRQKYEELMFEFHNSLSYIQEVQLCRTLEQLCQRGLSPHTGRALVLAQLYFPDLVKPLENYSLSQLSFYNSITESFDPNIPANAGGQAIISGNYMSPIKEFEKQKQAVMSSLISNSNKYTKA
jgi:hypothetical protein